MKSMFLAIFTMFSVAAQAKSVPKTLFEMSGVKRPEIDLEHSVLIVIDAQEEYRSGKLPLKGIKGAIQSIQKILAAARSKGTPVVHVMHEGSAGGLFDPGGLGFKSLPEVAPKAGEMVILKHFPDAFAQTSLLRELQKFGSDRTLIFVGFMTHMCITSTASTALGLGYTNAVVVDAVATRDLRGPSGETISAAVVNRSSLAALQDRIAWLVESDELLK